MIQRYNRTTRYNDTTIQQDGEIHGDTTTPRYNEIQRDTTTQRYNVSVMGMEALEARRARAVVLARGLRQDGGDGACGVCHGRWGRWWGE